MKLNTSLFISDAVQTRKVTLPDGTEHELHFKELPAAEFRRFYMAAQSKDEERQAGSMAQLIAACLCTPDGKPAITLKEALRLKPSAEKAISEAVLEVNGMGGQGNA